MNLRPLAIGLGLAGAVGIGALLAHRARPVPEPAPRLDAARLTAAIDYIARYLERDPRNPMLKGQIINRLIARFGQTAQLGDLERAETLARSGLDLAADPSSALSRLSGVLLMQHKFAPALDAAQRAVAADTGSAEARGTLMEAAIAGGRYDLADHAAARLDQGSVVGVVRRALWLDATGRTLEASRAMEQSCRELERTAADAPVIAWCLTQTAGMLHAIRGPAAARGLYERALAIDPGNRGGREGLANLALAEHHYAEARDRFEAILSTAHPDLFVRLAEAFRGLGLTDSARAAERRFLSIAAVPANEALFGNVLALYYAERGDRPALDSALAIAEREIARRPTNESYDLLGWVRYRRGELSAASEASDRSLRWGKLNPTMTFHRSRILLALGRRGEAARLLGEATAIPTLLAPHVQRALATL